MSAWTKTLDVSDVFRGNEPFTERRHIMVARVRFLDRQDDELQEIADRLSEAEDASEWDYAWDNFYDWADEHRVWVVTR